MAASLQSDPPDPFEPWNGEAWRKHTQLLLDSYRDRLGRDLIPREGSEMAQTRDLFLAPFVVVSHNTDADPLLTYGNRTALDLWQMDIAQFLGTPSRLTAEPVVREERERMLSLAARQGYIDDYSGIRVSSTGRRFAIESAIVWNLSDSQGRPAGQAATFTTWRFLD